MKDAELEAALAAERASSGQEDEPGTDGGCSIPGGNGMEQRNNLVLQGTETFSRGALDNVALEDGCLVLDSVAGRSLPYGSYTTPEFAMPAFCNLNVSWNAHAPHNTLVEVRCRVYAGGVWTGWLSFGKWAPDYPRCSVQAQSDDRLIFLMGDTVTVATPGGATGVQLQVNLSTNDDKATPAVRLLAAAVRPLAWNRQEGRVLNRQLYLPEYCLSAHDPTFGHEMDLPLVLAALMNRYGEDILPEEVAYAMEDHATRSTGNTAFAAAAAGCCGYPCWQAWMDLADLRTEITTAARWQCSWSAAPAPSGSPPASGWVCGALDTTQRCWRTMCC